MDRERITISIKKDLLTKIDKTIDGVVVRNRSHAVENLVSLSFGHSRNKDAVILVGGKGAVKLLPEVKAALKKLKESGFEKVYIALGALAEKVRESIGNGSEYDLIIEYVEEGEGTGGALVPFRRIFNDTFLVVNPSHHMTLPEHIGSVINFHKDRQSQVTVATNNLEELKGVYVFEPEVLTNLPEGFSMLEEDLFPQLATEGKLVVYPLI